MTTLFFDTETTGLTRPNKSPIDPAQPMAVQLGMKLDAANLREVGAVNALVQTDGWIVNPKATAVTGIDNDLADRFGIHLITAMDFFYDYVQVADVIVAHNAAFDITVMRRMSKVYAEMLDQEYVDPFEGKTVICTMLASMNIVKAMPKRNGQWKWPKLEECMKHFFNESIEGAHDALVDVRACARVYYHLHQIGAFADEHTREI